MLQFLDTDFLLIFGVIGLVLIALYLMKKPQSKGRSTKATIINHVTEAKIEILSEAETKKITREVYVFAEGVNEMLFEVRTTVRHLRELADDLDKVWRGCKTASVVGNTSSIAAGCMTVAGGVATAMTAGAAFPFLLAGTAFGGVGVCVDLGARRMESTSISSKTQEADAALKKVYGQIAEVKKQVQMLKDGKDQIRLFFVAKLAEGMIGVNHLAVALIEDCMRPDQLANSMSKTATKAVSDLALKVSVKEATTATTRAAGTASRNALFLGAKHIATEVGSKSGAVATVKAGSMAFKASKEIMKRESRAVVKVTTKSVSKAAARKAGGIIVGVSAAFLVLDAIQLHSTVRDIIENKGSDASRSLREKADELEVLVSA